MSYLVLGLTATATAALLASIMSFAFGGNTSNAAYGADQMSGNQMMSNNSTMSENSNPGSGALAGRAWGLIGSIQNDNSGNPAWIANGYWLMRIDQQSGNSTSNPVVLFRSTFEMVKLDGTSQHKHMISDFQLSSISDTGNVTTFNGTATITLSDGLHTGVQTSIKVLNHNVITIWFDPSATGGHFGNTPIYGTTAKLNDAYHTIVHGKMKMMSGS